MEPGAEIDPRKTIEGPLPPSSGEPFHKLRSRLEARRGELEQTTFARIEAIADPATVPDPAYITGLRAALTAGLNYGLSAIAAPARDPDPVPVELLAQARLAARNGVGLDAVLRRYSAGHTLLADGLIEEATALGVDADELRSALRTLATHYESIIAAVSEEHERESVAQPRDPKRRRLMLLRSLLAGEPLDPTAIGYPFEGHHLALVASGHDAASALAHLGESIDRLLLLAEPDALLAWAWLGGRRPFSWAELNCIASYPWPQGCSIASGEPGEGFARWRLSHRQAAAALSVAQRGVKAFVPYSDVALLASVVQDDVLAISLRRALLEPLRSERDGGEASIATLRAYFLAARNSSSAAAALGIDRRTVASRLTAIEERLGRSLDSVSAELEVALRLDELENSP